jgi:hypothetical protein
MWRALGAASLTLALAAACGSQPGAPAAVHSTTPAPQPAFAVLVKDFLVTGGSQYTISLVGVDGRVAATVKAAKRTLAPGVQVASVNTSGTRAYYLDGDSTLRFIKPDGGRGVATHFQLGPHQAAAFAVTPDDTRIAVSVLDFTQYPVGTHLYVEDLAGGGHHADLFSSTSVMEWPAGWHAGRLVLALGLNVPPQNLYEGFLRGHGYHVADAATATRIRSLCDGWDSFVPEVKAGTVCQSGTDTRLVSWEGDVRQVPKTGSCSPAGPMSPDGSLIATLGCGGSTVGLMDDSGKLATLSLKGEPGGWIDPQHVLVKSAAGADLILDARDGKTQATRAQGFFAAALPGGL